MICFCYFCQIWAWPIMTSFLCKKAIFKRFCQIFFGTTRMQHKLLILIESPNIFYWKSAKKGKQMWSLGQNLGRTRSNVAKKQQNWHFDCFFFSYFPWGIQLKARRSVNGNTQVEISQKYHISRKLGQNFCPFWVKNSKK